MNRLPGVSLHTMGNTSPCLNLCQKRALQPANTLTYTNKYENSSESKCEIIKYVLGVYQHFLLIENVSPPYSDGITPCHRESYLPHSGCPWREALH